MATGAQSEAAAAACTLAPQRARLGRARQTPWDGVHLFGDPDSLGEFAERALNGIGPVEPVSYRLRGACAWRDCGWVLDVRSRSGLFGRFCPVHAAELAEIRAVLEAAPVYRAKPGRRPRALARHLAEVDDLLGEAS